jgi:hypothetical protein
MATKRIPTATAVKQLTVASFTAGAVKLRRE